MNLGTIQDVIMTVLTVAGFGLEVFALVDATRHRKDAYTAAGKLTKTYWLIILGISVAVGVVSLPKYILTFLFLLPVVAASVYLVDVRPALRQVQGRGSSGPYGPW
jgi:hypothetical protein